MKYYAWAGWENKKLHFVLTPIAKVHGKSGYESGWLEVDADEENSIDNYDRGNGPRGSGQGIEVDGLNVFDNVQDARREIFRGLFS
jgi:hypothetical protein